MLSQSIFKRAFITLAITGFLNFISMRFYLYWSFWWMDMIVHFFGGLTVSLATLWVFSHLYGFKNWNTLRLITVSLMGSIFIGVIWELFELHFGITSLSDGVRYVTDTASDISMDIVGGIVGFFYTLNLLKKTNKIINN